MNNLSELSDRADIFSALYNEYYPQIYKYTLYRVGNHHTSEDLVSEVFEKVISKYHTYNSQKAKFSTWLFTIVNNTVINYYKKNQLSHYVGLENTESDYRIDDLLEEKEIKEILLKSITYLSDRQREVIALKFGARLTNREIAQIMDLSESNVGTILYRSLKQLKDVLKEHGLFD